MQRLRSWVSRDPGLALAILGMVLAAAIYLPTLGHGIVSYDDPWLLRDNHVLQSPSLDSLSAIFTDLDARSPARHALGAEYLPVRDLSVMLDFALWGDTWSGFHLTNLVLYLLGIALVFRLLTLLGMDRTIAGLAVAIWAVHPTHAESVAWLSERKGLLGLVFAAAAGIGYARFRRGDSPKFLLGAALATVAAVWSKAPAAFTIAALAGLECVLPGRVSWKRSLTGLATLGGFGVIAFLPVVVLASRAQVIGEGSAIPGGTATALLGIPGFYLRLGLMTAPNAISYPLTHVGPSAIDLVLGIVVWGALGAALLPQLRGPKKGAPRARIELRAAAVIWLFAWLPIGHVLIPLHQVGVADRYALVLTLGLALALACGIVAIKKPPLRAALAAVILLAGAIRAFDAQGTWAGDRTLWERAVASAPEDANAWSMYAATLEAAGQPEDAERAVMTGLSHHETPRLLLRLALLQLARGERQLGIETLRQAAEGGEPRAMANLALLDFDAGRRDDALAWARRATQIMPLLPSGHRARGKIALAMGLGDEALSAFTSALAIEPTAANRFNVALALLQLGRRDAAIPLLERCTADPALGPRARAMLGELRARRN